MAAPPCIRGVQGFPVARTLDQFRAVPDGGAELRIANQPVTIGVVAGLAAAAALIAVIIAGAVWLTMAESGVRLSPAMINVEGSDIGGPFELTSETGRSITSDELIDGPTLIYFGYTFCPDVCPLDTSKMAAAVDMLAEDGIEVKPVFITVDPARDTPEALAKWTDLVHPRLIGLTGTPEEIRTVADEYRVYYQKVELDDSAVGYVMDHTTYYYLMTPGQGLTAMFRDEITPDGLASDIERVLAAL